MLLKTDLGDKRIFFYSSDTLEANTVFVRHCLHADNLNTSFTDWKAQNAALLCQSSRYQDKV